MKPASSTSETTSRTTARTTSGATARTTSETTSRANSRTGSRFGRRPRARLLVQRSRGAPSAVLALCKVAQPPPGPGQLGLEILAAPINPVDQLRCRGHYPLLSPLPGVLGSEGVARVIEIGKEVAPTWRCGDLVLLPLRMGSFRSHANVPQDKLMRLPSGIDPKQASMLAICPTSAQIMLDQCELGPGDQVLNTPASGAVGQCVAQLARARKLQCTHIIRDPQWEPKLRALDPHSTILTLQALKARRNNRPFAHAALDGVGGTASKYLLSCLKDHRTLMSYGAMSRNAPALELPDLIFRGVRVQGFWLYQWVKRHGPKALHEVRLRLAQRMCSGELRIEIAQGFSIEDYAQAFEAAGSRGLKGRVLLFPNGEQT